MRISILDRAQKIVGDDDADALRRTLVHAQHAEKVGFRRFFVAEHHGVPGIPGSAPTVLAAAVAGATSTIRVGTAGIMLPAHQPLVAAEQIGVLEALYPGRIDAGIGNSVGFTQPVRDALRQGDPADLKAAFPGQLRELIGYLNGTEAISARPFNAAQTPVWLLAGFKSILLAGELGLNVIVGGPSVLDFSTDEHPMLARYRELHPAGQTAVAVNIAVADTEDDARELLMPQVVAEVRSRSTGSFDGLDPDASSISVTERERARVREGLAASIYGTPATVRETLRAVRDHCRVDEIVVTGGFADPAGQYRSEELLAELAAEL